jgi:hypothetical protein
LPDNLKIPIELVVGKPTLFRWNAGRTLELPDCQEIVGAGLAISAH